VTNRRGVMDPEDDGTIEGQDQPSVEHDWLAEQVQLIELEEGFAA